MIKQINFFLIYVQKPVTAPSSGDLTADLRRKLVMRRKGISGSKENAAQASNAAASIVVPSSNPIDSISSMISPPPKPAYNHSDNDNDNENDPDWE